MQNAQEHILWNASVDLKEAAFVIVSQYDSASAGKKGLNPSNKASKKASRTTVVEESSTQQGQMSVKNPQ